MDGALALAQDASASSEHEADAWRTPARINPALAQLAVSRRVLLLQGPVGPFFDRLTLWLQARGTEVRRVVFQGGDEFDCRVIKPIRFQQGPTEWPAACNDLLEAWRPDCIALFGQSRHYHKVALERARAMDMPVVVMEEGYFRPGFVTMELGGVNAYSTTLDRFAWRPAESDAAPEPDACERHFQKMAWHACRHYWALTQNERRYPHYQHHRSTGKRTYTQYWLSSWVRKCQHLRSDFDFQAQLFTSRRPYFFVPLQLDGDSQIRFHSPFRGTADFVLHVMQSFAAHASDDSWLVFKQHPHARGGYGNHRLVTELARALGIEHRVHHMVEGDTPDLAEHSMGTVVINSTVGLQALERGSPLMVLGDAMYKRPDLAFPGPLRDFWLHGRPAEPALANRFLAEIKALTQAPASIYAWRGQLLNWATS